MVSLLDLGPLPLADIFSFLEPQSQHELRRTTSAAALLFDWATEASWVPFYNVYDAIASTPPHPRPTNAIRWKAYPAHIEATAEKHENIVVNVRSCQHSGIAYSLEETIGRGSSEAPSVSSPLPYLVCNKLFVAGLDGVKAIGSRFCANVMATEIIFDGADTLESIRHDFLYDCPNLRKVAFRERMPRLATIGHRFMAHCPRLEEVDLSGLVALVNIGKRHLSRCPPNIASDVGRVLRFLISENARFALPCSPSVTLEDLDVADVFCFLDPESQHELRSTSLLMTFEFDRAADEEGFLFMHASVVRPLVSEGEVLWAHCPFHSQQTSSEPMVTVHARNFRQSHLFSTERSSVYWDSEGDDNDEDILPIFIPIWVLSGIKCKTLFVTGLDGVKEIGSRFCSNVTATEIIIGEAHQLEGIDRYFLHRCPNLTRVVFRGPMPRLTMIGGDFMAECPQLQEVDFSGLVALKEIGARCLFECTALVTIDFSPFGATLEHIGKYLLSRAHTIANLEGSLRTLTALQEIGSVGVDAPVALVNFAAAFQPKV